MEEFLGCIIVATINALAACAEVGIIHRNVKPTNILLRYPNEIKLGDFGESGFLQNDISTSYAGISQQTLELLNLGGLVNITPKAEVNAFRNSFGVHSRISEFLFRLNGSDMLTHCQKSQEIEKCCVGTKMQPKNTLNTTKNSIERKR